MTWSLMSGQPVALNVEPATVADARLTLGHEFPIVAGVMARRFASTAEGVAHTLQLAEAGILVSIGLGDGAADQWDRALDLALATRPAHLNQVFPAAGLSQRSLDDAGAPTLVNALVAPSRPGRVVVTTGPRSNQHSGELPVPAALDMLIEVGVRSVKLFPVEGLHRLEDIVAVAHAAAARDMLLEPTGGIAPNDLPPMLDAVLATGCHVMPHLYGSVKDQAGALSQERMEHAVSAVAKVLGRP